MDLVERFRYIMKLNNLTASAFASQIGVQASSVSHVLSGRNKPSLEFIQKVLLAYPKIDSSWLINGTTKVQEKSIVPEETPQKNPIVEDDQPKKEAVREKKSTISLNQEKKINRILIFYSDGTFEEFQSSKESS